MNCIERGSNKIYGVPFKQNKSITFEISTFLPACQFLSVFAKTFQNPSVSEISTFIGLFCLKRTLVQPKIVVGVLSCDTESWFPIQLTKNAKISSSKQESQNVKFHWLVLSKRLIS